MLGRWYPPPPKYFTQKRLSSPEPVPPPTVPLLDSTTDSRMKVQIVGRTLEERRRALFAARLRMARNRAQAAATSAIPLPPPPAPLVLHDYKGWYEMLGVQPNADYIQPSLDDAVTERLKERRIAVAFRYHRDQGGSDQKMTQLNIAWDMLKGVAGRIKYHERKL